MLRATRGGKLCRTVQGNTLHAGGVTRESASVGPERAAPQASAHLQRVDCHLLALGGRNKAVQQLIMVALEAVHLRSGAGRRAHKGHVLRLQQNPCWRAARGSRSVPANRMPGCYLTFMAAWSSKAGWAGRTRAISLSVWGGLSQGGGALFCGRRPGVLSTSETCNGRGACEDCSVEGSRSLEDGQQNGACVLSYECVRRPGGPVRVQVSSICGWDAPGRGLGSCPSPRHTHPDRNREPAHVGSGPQLSGCLITPHKRPRDEAANGPGPTRAAPLGGQSSPPPLSPRGGLRCTASCSSSVAAAAVGPQASTGTVTLLGITSSQSDAWRGVVGPATISETPRSGDWTGLAT